MESSLVIEELRGILDDAGLEARLRGHTHTSSDAERLERVYTAVFHTRINRTCGNCLHDAYVLLKINAKNMKNMKERVECAFALKAGAILRVPDGKGGRTLYSNANLTDAVARAWLKANPQSAVLFAKMPDGFIDELKATVAGTVSAAREASESAPVEAGRLREQRSAEVKPATAKKTAAKGKKTAKKTTKKK